ncbi:MAG: hypothetical protein IT204_02845 [Fimbriimonadaceae bacterium]|nr:hypothetical protein [Fimbriimonadaceae bacterium]
MTVRLRQQLQPLLAILEPVHGPRLRAVIAYGPWCLDDDRSLPKQVLVVLDDAASAQLRATAPQVGLLRRQGIEPFFLSQPELARSLDVFPLEFLDMQACYEVVAGDDLLADLTFPPAALRLQIEEELRGGLHRLRQEVGRYGHHPKVMRQVLAQSFSALHRVWRALLRLRDAEMPAAVEALLQQVAAVWELDPQLLGKLHRLELGQWRPEPTAVETLVDDYDRLLERLIDRVDTLLTEGR